MKKVTAIVRLEKTEPLKAALEEQGYSGMTITPVSGSGKVKGSILQFRGRTYQEPFVPRAKFELVVSNAELDTVSQIILSEARTGRIGDGKIFVEPVEQAIRIRDGQKGEVAIGAGRLIRMAPAEKPVEALVREYEHA